MAADAPAVDSPAVDSPAVDSLWPPAGAEALLGGQVGLFHGDCLEVLRGLPAESVDAVVTDPPYHLTSIVKRFGAEGAAPARARDAYARASKGFMGQRWDGGDVAFRPETWVAVGRVLKPGGHLLAFGGTRGFHRMVCAIEDAGLEVRDSLAWLYGCGFPKSHSPAKGRPEMADWSGWGTALKPAVELIALLRKPLREGSVARQLAATGTGALNIDGCRVGGGAARIIKGFGRDRAVDDHLGGFNGCVEARETDAGRWPANVLTDGSAEVAEAFARFAQGEESPLRFFYSAKADALDRAGSAHPTVKPVALMRWLLRLVTPPGGVVLDPFAGSGTTGQAAFAEGVRALLIEREAGYCDDIRRRMALAASGPLERRKATAEAAPAGPLFAGVGS